MAFKVMVVASLAVVVSGIDLLPAQQLSYISPISGVVAPPEEFDSHPRYTYGYDVHDTLTGDAKSHHETRDGDVVQGSYFVVDPDGIKRTVEYTSDPQNGFNAMVYREPIGQVSSVVTKVAGTPIIYSDPANTPVQAYAAAQNYAVAPTYGASSSHVAAPAYPAAPTYAAVSAYTTVPAYAASPVVHATPIAKFVAPSGNSASLYPR